MKIKLVINIGILKKQLYLRTVLNKIELVKRLFIIEIQRGSECAIPPELSIKEFPMSFRFYDPIFHMINKYIDTEKKLVYYLKTQSSLKALEEKDNLRNFKKIIGISNDGVDEKLSFK
jgi:hypothetical protein